MTHPTVRKSPLVALGLALTVALAVAACSGGSPADGTDPTKPPQRRLTVFAAASLTSVFEKLAKTFEADHPGVTVALSFAGSSDLAAQIVEGAPADVFAAADTTTMGKVADAGLVDGTPTDFASNTLEIAVPAGNPAHITSLADLTRKGVVLVVCAPQVPCGSATAKVAASAGVRLSPISEEQSVTDVLAKVRSGDADAGLVYVTDVLAAGDDVEGVPFPESAGAVNTYPVATVKGAAQPELARAFVDLVTGAEGQRALAAAGFAGP